MATLKELNIKLGADTKELQSNMRKAANDLRREARNFGQIGTELSLAVSLPLLGIGASALRAAGDIEAFKMGFNTTMKAAGRSAADAAKEMEALREIAKMPGIDFEQAIKGSMRLQGVGMSAEKARKIMEELANGIAMAGGTAQEFDGVTRQLAQMSGKGRVLQEDLTILLENMPMLAKVLNDTFGTANAEKLREMGVNAQDFIDGVTNGLSKLERVPGGLQNSIVNFGVEVKMALATVGESINKAFNVTGKLEDFAGWISDAAARFSQLSEGTQKAIITTLGITAAIGPAIKVFSIWNNTKAAAIDLASKAVGAYKSLAGAVLVAAEKFAAMDKVTKATTIGMIAVAIGAAVLVFQQFNDELTTTARIQKNLENVTLAAEQAIAAERMEAEANIKVLRDENATRAEKEKALKRLNEIGGDYFKGLNIEKTSVTEINAAYEKYIANLLQAAKAKAAQDKILELEKQRLDLADKLAKQQERMKGSLGFIADTSGAGSISKNLAQQIADLEAQQKALADLAFKSAPVASTGGTASGGSTTFTPTGKPDKKTSGKKKEEVDAMKELAAAMSTADAKAAALGTTFDATQAKTDAIRNAIETLIGQGVTPSDERLSMLSERYKNLTATLEPLPGMFNAVTGAMQLSTTVQDVVVEKADAMTRAFQTMGIVVNEAMATAGMAMQDAAAQGETSFKKMGAAALKSAANVVRAALMEYVATVVKNTAIASGPFGAFLAPAAGAAAGFAFNALLKGLKVPALAEGSYAVNRPTLALIGEKGPEMVIPPKKLPGVAAMAGLTRNNGGGDIRLSGEFRVQGTDLVLVLEKANQQQFRSFGR
jgi:tape measure domain-containing protein